MEGHPAVFFADNDTSNTRYKAHFHAWGYNDDDIHNDERDPTVTYLISSAQHKRKEY